MTTRSPAPSFLVLAANTPWVYAFAQALTLHSKVTAVRLHDFANYRRLRPQWPEIESPLRRVSVVMPQGYAGSLELLFRPLMRGMVAREQRRLLRVSGTNPVVVCPFPYLASWVRGVPEGRLVYYSLDEYQFYNPARTTRILRQEGELVARACLTVCLSACQVEVLRARNPARANRIQHFPLGVVEDLLNPAPGSPPLPNTVGYVGNLTDRVDWAFFAAVAELVPDAKFHVVGRLDSIEDNACWRRARTRALELANVVYEGEVTQAQVREHYWRYAVNWMPYDTSHGFNIASCPTKIMDALASGRPFVSTDIPEVRLYPGRIHIARTPDKVAATLRAILGGRVSHDAHEQTAFAARQTWSTRALEFQSLLERSASEASI